MMSARLADSYCLHVLRQVKVVDLGQSHRKAARWNAAAMSGEYRALPEVRLACIHRGYDRSAVSSCVCICDCDCNAVGKAD
jgi:hypothetical protein